MAQTSYPTTLSNGVAGQAANQDRRTVHTALAEAAMPFGVGVTKGASDNTCKVPVLSSTALIGVSMSSFANANASFALGIQQYDAVSVCSKGAVWVISETAVTANTSAVFCRYATGTGTVIGSFRTDADTATAAVVPGARWLTSCLAGGLAQLEVNLPA